MPVSAVVVSYLGFLVVLVTLWLAFRPIPAKQAMRSLLGFNTLVYLFLSLISFANLITNSKDVDGTAIAYGFYGVFFIVAVSGVSYLYVRSLRVEPEFGSNLRRIEPRL